MRRFVDQIEVHDRNLMRHIICSLEHDEIANYEVDMCERDAYDMNAGKRSSGECFTLKVYEKVDMTETDEQLSMDLK